MTQETRRNFLISAALFLVCLSLPASALTFWNGGAHTTPRTAAAGQAVNFTINLYSPEAVSNVTVSFQVRPYTPGGAISSTAVFTKTVTGLNFTAGEKKQWTWSYTVPSTLATGEYAWVTKATNSTGSVVYIDVARTDDSYTFHVNGVAAKRYVRGINNLDLCNKHDSLPGIYGTDYPKPTLAGMQRLKSRGLDVVRIPFIWERIQPVLNGGLNTTYLGYLLETLQHANSAGLGVILDMHNYARYASNGVKRPFGSVGAPSEEEYADAWRLIVSAIKSNPAAYNAIYAYDIMNEPHDLPYQEGTFSYPVMLSSFESSTEGWVPRDSPTTSVSRVVRNNQGSLKITTTASAGSGKVFGAQLPASAKRPLITNGPTFQAKVFVPTSTPGIIRARVRMTDSAWQPHYSAEFAVTKGEETRVYFKPPDAVWTNNQGIFVEFIVDSSDGSAPFVFYVDQVAQGTQTGQVTPQQVWESYSQAAVDAIRDLKDGKMIMVEGYTYSSAELWPENHPRKWINDRQNNIMYQAHFYFDKSGKYLSSHADELDAAKKQGYATVGQRGIAQVKKFTDWVAAQGTQGFLGEYGWPSTTMSPDDGAAWNADGEELLQFLDEVGMGATMWTTGTWENLPSLNINAAYQIEPSLVPLSQAEVLERHLGKP